MKEDAIKKLMLMVSNYSSSIGQSLTQHPQINAVHQQRDLLLHHNPPKYIMPLEWVRQMISQVQQANLMFRAWVGGHFPNGAARPPAAGPSQPPGGQGGPSGAPQPGQMPQAAQRVPISSVPQPPTSHPVPSAPTPDASSPAAPPPHTPAATSPPFIGTPIQKKPTPKPAAESSSAPTPTHAASPQTPQTPKVKAAAVKPKPKPQPRKPSKSIAPAAASPSAGPSETKPPVTPAAATPAASASTPDASTSLKRSREEDPSTPAGPLVAPAAKKIKTEWDDSPSEVFKKREADLDNVKSDDDAIKFFDQMASWLNQVSSDGDGRDGSNSMQTIARELEDILQAYPTVPDDGSFMDPLAFGGGSPKLNAASVDPADFFDFSSYERPETESKAATPDLVQASSSVGPSPGSASETEAHPSVPTAADTAKIVEPKTEPSDGDAMPPELWQSIDGGESAFFNASDNWKWDQPMNTVDQPWAFYSS